MFFYMWQLTIPEHLCLFLYLSSTLYNISLLFFFCSSHLWFFSDDEGMLGISSSTGFFPSLFFDCPPLLQPPLSLIKCKLLDLSTESSHQWFPVSVCGAWSLTQRLKHLIPFLSTHYPVDLNFVHCNLYICLAFDTFCSMSFSLLITPCFNFHLISFLYLPSELPYKHFFLFSPPLLIQFSVSGSDFSSLSLFWTSSTSVIFSLILQGNWYGLFFNCSYGLLTLLHIFI